MTKKALLTATLNGTIAVPVEPAFIKSLEIDREPLVGCKGGFKPQFTILGSASMDRAHAYCSDFLSLMPKPEFQGRLLGENLYNPTIVIGSARYVDIVTNLKSSEHKNLIAIEVTEQTTVDQLTTAIWAVVRHAPDLFLIENISDRSLISRQVLTTIWQSGDSIATPLLAQSETHLFEQILPALEMPEIEIPWVSGKERGVPEIQVHFEGRSVTDTFIRWLNC
jgi:hypothetical protein